MTAQPEPIPVTPDPAPTAQPGLSLVKEPKDSPGASPDGDAAPVEDTVEDQEHDDVDKGEDLVLGGGILAEITALVGREAWIEFAHETGALMRDVAVRFAGLPSRIVRATWRATVTVLVRIKDGSVILGASIAEWVTAEETKAEPAKTDKKGESRDDAKSTADDSSDWPRPVRRGGLLLLVAAGLVHQGKDDPVTVAVVAASVWSAAAIVASRSGRAASSRPAGVPSEKPAEQTTSENDHEILGETGESEEVPTRDQAAAGLIRYVEHAVAAAKHLHKHKGVHTETLLDGINRTEGLRAAILDPIAPHGEEWDVPSLNAALSSLGIPIHSKGFKLIIDGKQRVRAGVRYEELAQYLGRRPHLPPSLVEDRTRVYATE
ncbi:hypothetical protein ACFYZ8_34035 [Streptomyces sp. NPDC001668]|uniref:hypothetical protein n=1 Tax=Streptomyces sp. NPDC001668 TaxID=3364598 RepID=UPI0036C81868